jgi:hypothetical protein
MTISTGISWEEGRKTCHWIQQASRTKEAVMNPMHHVCMQHIPQISCTSYMDEATYVQWIPQALQSQFSTHILYQRQ